MPYIKIYAAARLSIIGRFNRSFPNNEVYLGVTLSASYSFQDLDGNGEGDSAYQWQRNDEPIGGGTAQSYTVSKHDLGKVLTVKVTPRDNAVPAETGAPVVSNAVTVALASSASAVLTVSAGLKQLHFAWAAVADATRYRLLYSPDGVAAFALLAADSDNLTVTDYDWDIGVHRINWPQAQFRLQACDAANACLQSASVSALNVMLSTIGYFKASNTGGGDRFGYSIALSADGNTLAVGAPYEGSANSNGNPVDDCNTTNPANCARESGSVYVYARSGATWLQQAYVKASNVGAGDNFGNSVALSTDGDTLAVGAFFESSATTGVIPGAPTEAAAPNSTLNTGFGAVYVYTRSGTAWAQQAYVKASNTGASDWFGYSVALSGDGNTLAVGAYQEDSASIGATPGSPSEIAMHDRSSTMNSGAVYVFTRSGGGWTQQAYVKASNTGAFDSFGVSVALSGDGNTLAVGAYGEASAATGVNNTVPGQGDNLAPDSGAVYVFTRSGGAWAQQAYVKASNTGANDYFGNSVALSSDGFTLAVGAYFEGSAKTGVISGAPAEADTSDDALGAFSGAVYVYTRSGGAWAQQAYVKASNTGAYDYFGSSVALSADGLTLAVGAYAEDNAKTGVIPGVSADTDTPDSALDFDSGAAYVFTRSGGVWAQQAYVKASNTGVSDSFGRSVALSADGSTLAVGAYGEASAATGLGGNQFDGCAAVPVTNCATGAGAVYLY